MNFSLLFNSITNLLTCQKLLEVCHRNNYQNLVILQE